VAGDIERGTAQHGAIWKDIGEHLAEQRNGGAAASG